jgi:hypothetical protein
MFEVGFVECLLHSPKLAGTTPRILDSDRNYLNLLSVFYQQYGFKFPPDTADVGIIPETSDFARNQ